MTTLTKYWQRVYDAARHQIDRHFEGSVHGRACIACSAKGWEHGGFKHVVVHKEVELNGKPHKDVVIGTCSGCSHINMWIANAPVKTTFLARELWLEYVENGLCGLCGNAGYLTTLGGTRKPCICHNGRIYKYGTMIG